MIQNRQSHSLTDLPTDKQEGGLNITELIDSVLRRLPLILGCTVAFSGLGLLKVITTPPSYSASFELLSEPLNIETKVTSTNDASRETREQIASVDLDSVQLKILKSPRLILRVIEALQYKYPTLNYQELISGLSIEIVTNKNSNQNILQVVYEDIDREKVADIIDTVNEVYLEYSIEKRQSSVTRGISFLDRQIPRVSKQAQNIEDKIQDLRNQYNFIEPDISIKRINEQLDNSEKEKKNTNTKLRELQQKTNNLERELNNGYSQSSTAIELADSQYNDLISQLQAIEVEIGRKSAIFSDRSIELQTLNQEKQEIIALIVREEAVIRQKLTNQINTLTDRQQLLTAEVTELKTQLKKWSDISQNYNNLQQKLSRTNNKLNEFISQKDALAIDAARQETPWQVLTPIAEPRTNSVGAINYLMLSSTLGLLFGVALALVIDRMQNIIYTSNKVEEITSLPIIANLPYNSQNKKRLALPQTNLPPLLKGYSTSVQISPQPILTSDLLSPSIEPFRSFAVNLNIFNYYDSVRDVNNNSGIKSFVITSAISGEGKSTVALNLARASASLGKRVLLVDTDLRSNYSLTKSLNLESEMGLWNLLQRENSVLEFNSMKKVTIENNLSILTSGFNEIQSESTSSDPGRLLASTNMQRLMEEFKIHFDLVIYDLCSIIGFADVNLLANRTDGIVMVTGLGKTNTIVLTEALNQLTLSKAPIFGIALNKVASNAKG